MKCRPCINWGDERLPKRFWDKVSPCPVSGCWHWIGPGNYADYGKSFLNGKHTSSHRKAWTVLVDEIPTSMTIDHLCRNTRCCNPAHLEVVTMRENTLRGTSMPAINNHLKSKARRAAAIAAHEEPNA